MRNIVGNWKSINVRRMSIDVVTVNATFVLDNVESPNCLDGSDELGNNNASMISQVSPRAGQLSKMSDFSFYI